MHVGHVFARLPRVKRHYSCVTIYVCYYVMLLRNIYINQLYNLDTHLNDDCTVTAAGAILHGDLNVPYINCSNALQ